MGTAVNIQSMVFGNLGANSGTGVAFTRNPSTGKNIFYGEWLENAQGRCGCRYSYSSSLIKIVYLVILISP